MTRLREYTLDDIKYPHYEQHADYVSDVFEILDGVERLRAALSSQGTPSEPTRDFRQCPHGSGKRTDCRECKRLMDERIARGECIDCGRLHPGSSSVFTVCDACWDRAHPGRAPGVTAPETLRKYLCEICNVDPCACEISEADYYDPPEDESDATR